jgi:hypothetical protein
MDEYGIEHIGPIEDKIRRVHLLTIAHPFSSVLYLFEKFQLPIFIDRNSSNFILTKAGEVFYLDMAARKDRLSCRNIERCANYVHISADKQRTIAMAMQRLETIPVDPD